MLLFPRCSSFCVTYSLSFSPVRHQLPSIHSNILVPQRYISSNASNNKHCKVQSKKYGRVPFLLYEFTERKTQNLVSREVSIQIIMETGDRGGTESRVSWDFNSNHYGDRGLRWHRISCLVRFQFKSLWRPRTAVAQFSCLVRFQFKSLWRPGTAVAQW